MISIIDYGVGNLFSLKSSFDAVGAEASITQNADEVINSDKIILPGVGAFRDAAKKLKKTGLGSLLINEAKKGKPILGICLGMQLLFEKSYEFGECEGLGLIPGKIVPISDVIPKDFKIPHIGWNGLEFTDKGSYLFKHINNGDFVYFVHSYYASECGKYVTAYTDYGAKLTASVENANVYGCQFHPEKSGKVGLSILKAFCDL